ncbi:MAG: response regulator, partial [Myxococcota bacterium]
MNRKRVLVVDDHFELAELLSAALENEGLEAVVACSGQEALREARVSPPDLAIVDLGLPDMLGTELLEALAGFDPPVPAVAMSGIFRGERYDHDATFRYGARLFFEKPFSTTMLVRRILELLGEMGEQEKRSEREEGEDEPLIMTLTETVHPDSGEEEIFPDAAEVLGDEELASPLPEPSGGHGAPALEEESESAGDFERCRKARRRQMGFVEDMIEVEPAAFDAPGGAQSVEEEAPSSVDPSLPGLVSPGPPAPRSREPAAPSRGGELGASTVPRLLVAFHQAGSTGALEVRRGRVTKVIYLRDGQPVFAASNLAGDRLLAFAVSRGAIRKEDAESALALAQEGGQRIGEILVELGVLDRRLLQRLVRDQVRAVIWSTFARREGSYAIRARKESRKEPIALNLPLGALILE